MHGGLKARGALKLHHSAVEFAAARHGTLEMLRAVLGSREVLELDVAAWGAKCAARLRAVVAEVSAET